MTLNFLSMCNKYEYISDTQFILIRIKIEARISMDQTLKKTKVIGKRKEAKQKLRKGAKCSHTTSVLNKMLRRYGLKQCVKAIAFKRQIKLNKNNRILALKLRMLSMDMIGLKKTRSDVTHQICQELRNSCVQNNNKKFFEDKKKRKSNNTSQFKFQLISENQKLINAIQQILWIDPQNEDQIKRAAQNFFNKNKQGNLDHNQKQSLKQMTEILCLPKSQVQDLQEYKKAYESAQDEEMGSLHDEDEEEPDDEEESIDEKKSTDEKSCRLEELLKKENNLVSTLPRDLNNLVDGDLFDVLLND